MLPLLLRFWRFCGSVLFPSTAEERRLSSLSPDELYERVERWHRGHIHRIPVSALFVFRNTLMRAAIHAAKYRGRKDLCEMFGAFLWDEFGEDLSTQALLKNIVWSVVPVPMNAHKRRTRGYNHADWIARGFLARADATAFIFSPKLLAHRGGTESQARTASRGARQKNILGAFTCPQKNAVSGASVIVLDDVVTTGATLREAARVLKNSGARRVVCIAVAH